MSRARNRWFLKSEWAGAVRLCCVRVYCHPISSSAPVYAFRYVWAHQQGSRQPGTSSTQQYFLLLILFSTFPLGYCDEFYHEKGPVAHLPLRLFASDFVHYHNETLTFAFYILGICVRHLCAYYFLSFSRSFESRLCGRSRS